MIWLQLLYVYLKIGILGFGGGYAMLSLIQADRGGPLWLDFLAGVYRYSRYLSNDTRADRYQ